MPRLDLELVRRGLARSRSHAHQLISGGLVHIDGTVAAKPAERVSSSAVVTSHTDHYVSRAAHKLLGALADLDLTVSGRALDAGASTGGFTQVLLERGCIPVYAVDVGSGQLADVLRADSRVVSHEQTNLRDLDLSHVGDEPVDVVVADVSFISLALLVGPLTRVLRPTGRLLAMVKPQFEVGRVLLGKGGVVRSAALHRQAIAGVIDAAEEQGWFTQGVVPSRLPGLAGNIEYFVLFASTPAAVLPDLEQVVAAGPRTGAEERRVSTCRTPKRLHPLTYAVAREPAC